MYAGCSYLRRIDQSWCPAAQVSAQALRVTEQMVHIIRPDPGKAVPAKLKVSPDSR